MKKLFSVISLLAIFNSLIVLPVLAATPTPSPESAPSESVTENLSNQINNLKEKIASRVAQLNLVEKRGILGTVIKVQGTQITLNDHKGDEHVVDVDEITKFSSSSQANFGISDIEKGDKISVIGLYNKESERILARFITTTTIPRFVSGAVTAIDEDNFVITVTTPEEKELKVDIEKVTKTLSYAKDEYDAPTKAGFSDIEQGVRVTVIGYDDVKEENRITATRILLFPDLPKNPKIVIPQNAVDTSKDTVTSSGSGKKLTPL